MCAMSAHLMADEKCLSVPPLTRVVGKSIVNVLTTHRLAGTSPLLPTAACRASSNRSVAV